MALKLGRIGGDHWPPLVKSTLGSGAGHALSRYRSPWLRAPSCGQPCGSGAGYAAIRPELVRMAAHPLPTFEITTGRLACM